MPRQSPRVSIVIRAKNEEFWLGKTLEQINNQTFADYEVVLVDSGSTDSTVAIFRHYRPDDVLVELDAYKPGDAINRGIAAGSGDLAVVLSAHCIPADANWLDRFVAVMDNEQVGAAYGRQLPLPSSHPFDKRDLLNIFGVEPRIQKIDTFFHNANSVIRRKVWEQFPFDPDIPHIEDRLWAQQVITEGYYIAYEPDAAVYHHHGINHHSDLMRAEAISDILVRSTMKNGNEYPEFLAPDKEPILFCLLGHARARDDRYAPLAESLAGRFSQGKVMVNTRDPELFDNRAAHAVLRREDEDHLTFVDIMARMLAEAEAQNFFPNCVVYLNPRLEGLSEAMVDDLVRLFFKGMYDSVFFAREEFNNLWFKDKDTYRQLRADYSPRLDKTPVFVSQYGLGVASNPRYIRSKDLVGPKVGIIPLRDDL